MGPILYFGCFGDVGHYLFWRVDGAIRHAYHLDQNLRTATPWGYSIDGGVFGDSRRKHEAGVVHWAQRDGWTAISFADYSVDRRPGSHSTFVVHEDVGADALLAEARTQYPEVFARKGFPSVRMIGANGA